MANYLHFIYIIYKNFINNKYFKLKLNKTIKLYGFFIKVLFNRKN